MIYQLSKYFTVTTVLTGIYLDHVVSISRTSAPLVKVNSTYLKHKVGPRQHCCTVKSCP